VQRDPQRPLEKGTELKQRAPRLSALSPPLVAHPAHRLRAKFFVPLAMCMTTTAARHAAVQRDPQRPLEKGTELKQRAPRLSALSPPLVAHPAHRLRAKFFVPLAMCMTATAARHAAV